MGHASGISSLCPRRKERPLAGRGIFFVFPRSCKKHASQISDGKVTGAPTMLIVQA
ncbi:hypothetical protein DESPIG_02786 [Desulfovibrio piger ATCC 29098]|uniref:Uncharacterized protein n=1 Tax=Desulfovibrio piger ATCC 29098 TaxID=411464 RepID=B6WXG0_9BACT|nr:hypothetical protein DESPIG_02786 [Desulfovibrio piger ATCC 29098]